MLLFEIAVVLLLIVCNGVFAMTELAVVSSRRSRLESLAEEGRRGARIVLGILSEPTAFLSTVQIGITLVGVLAGAFGGAMLAEPFGAWLDGNAWIAPHGEAVALAIVVVSITYLSLVFGELVPKRVALADPERIAAISAPFMQALSRAASPAVWVLKGATEGVLRLTGLEATRASHVTEDEVRLLVAEGTRAGVFVPKEREMIEAVLRLADRTARGLMTPRSEVAWLDLGASAAEIAERLRESRRSRFPVCRGAIDHPVGIVNTKDLARAVLEGAPVSLEALMQPPLLVLDGTPVLRLLDSFRREGVHMAVVVDEYGSTLGVVTAGDILEAVAGDLPELGEEVESNVVAREDGSWLVDGSVAIDEFEHRVAASGLSGSRSYETVAGYVLYRLGRLPNVGETFDDAVGRFEVVDMDGRRIDKIVFRPSPPAIEEEDG
jgi:putative hemolysin